MKKDDEPVAVEQTFNVSAETVWRAITEIDQMRQWYFDNIPDFKPEAGFQTQFTVSNEGRDFLHMWTVTDVVPLKKLVYDWKYEQYPGEGSVVWELFDQGQATRLRLSMHVREDFPDDVPEFKRESCVGGWEYFIQGRLKEYLEKP
jgi:uncharacterized protein YndB with AHSA1/START domain